MRTIIILLISIFASVNLFSQEKIYVSYFEAINMHFDYEYSSMRLFQLYVSQDSKYELILPEKDTVYYIETKEQAIAKASKMGIPHVLTGTFNRVGERVIISLVMYKTETGEKEWESLQKASSPEDIDPIMQSMAQSLNSPEKTNGEQDIYNVSNFEQKELNKKTATIFYGFEIGGGGVFMPVDKPFPAGFGVMLSGDLRSLIVDIKGSFYFSDVNIYHVSIHGNYPLSKKSNTPFLSAGIGFGGTNMVVENSSYYYSNREDGSGLTLYGGGGYILKRNSSINLRIGANAFVSGYTVNGINPAGVLGTVAILFSTY